MRIKKLDLILAILVSVIGLAACTNAESSHLKGVYYDSEGKSATLNFYKGKDDTITYGYTTGTLPNGTYEMVWLTLKYKIEGQQITFKWGNKKDADFKFKPGDVVGKGQLSKDHKTITMAKHNQGKFWYPSFGKDNKQARAHKRAKAAASDAAAQKKAAVKADLKRLVKVQANAKCTWTKADFDALHADNRFGSTKGTKGTSLAAVLAKYPHPSAAQQWSTGGADIMLSYGPGDQANVTLAFKRLANGGYSLIQKHAEKLK